jgi:NAD+ synthase
LYCLFEKKISIEETAKITLIEKSIVEKIHELNINSEHKRLPAQKPENEKE